MTEASLESDLKYVNALAYSGKEAVLSNEEAAEIIDFLITFSYGTAKYFNRPESSFSRALPLFIAKLTEMGFGTNVIQLMVSRATGRLSELPVLR